MNMYEKLMEKSDLTCRKAIECLNKKDVYMARFWKNASIGFKQKAMKLTIDDFNKFLSN